MQRFLVSLAVLILFTTVSVVPSGAADREKLEQRVTEAQFAFRDFQKDPRMTWFRENVRYAKGLLIMPTWIRGGFFLGGYVGNGVLVAQDRDGSWSNPAFYDVLAGSFGLQFGIAGGQVILMIMTDTGLRRFLGDKFQLGADASIGVGPEGIGAKAELFDIFSFARVKGLYGGLTLEGGGVIVNNNDNRTYYGDAKLTPTDILIRRKAQNPQADKLIRTLTEATR